MLDDLPHSFAQGTLPSAPSGGAPSPVEGAFHSATLESVFGAPHLMWLLADDALVVRAVFGNVEMLHSGESCIGEALPAVAPELAGRTDDLAALLGGRLERLDIGLVRRSMRHKWNVVWAQAWPVRDAAGSIVGIAHMLAEASSLGERWERSERQRRELGELRHRLSQLSMHAVLAQSELKTLDDAKSQFVSVAAHELRNPLASLIGYLELLETENDAAIGEPQRTYLAGVQRGAQRLRVLTNNLLDITRLDSNRLELLLAITNSLELVEQAVAEMGSLFDAKHQQLILKAEPALPPVWCDQLRCMQVLTNLLSNANKYTPEGGAITIQVRRMGKQPMVCISVRDTGIGIPADDQNRIFTRFYRASNAGGADGSGAGLGLVIAQSLIRLHGGKLWFESKQGEGTRFSFTLPMAT